MENNDKQKREYIAALKRVEEAYRNHKGEWITKEIALDYCDRGKKLFEKQDCGRRRELRIELQEKYGLLELEALNIINGYYITEYVSKYWHIKNRIPMIENNEKYIIIGANELKDSMGEVVSGDDEL